MIGSLLDVQGSFVIGGILMLSLLGLNLTISTSHNELAFGHISQSTADELIDIIRNDFRKIGHRVTGQDPVQVFSSARIAFLADLHNNGDIERVEYSLSDTTAVTQTTNPHDRYLYRTIDGSLPEGVALGVVKFNLLGFDDMGDTTTVPEALRTIEIDLAVEATESVSHVYNRAVRRASVSPVALGFD
jgi:hypothetical protein